MTRSQTHVSYEQRLDRVLDHIHAHLDDDISLDTLAEIACLSTFHWHRIYTAMRGETLAATVKRLRLTRASDRLANSAMPVAEIARRSGYGSVEAFGRAFKDAFGQSPADYRGHGSHAAFKAATASVDVAGFPVSVIDLEEMHCAAVPHVGPYMQIDRAMGRLFTGLASQALLTEGTRMIGVFFDDPDLHPIEALRSCACSPIGVDAQLAPPLEGLTLRGGTYARLRYRGPYADMGDAYRWLWRVWLPNSGYEPADAPVFEEYLNDPRHVAPTDLLTDIHVPLEATL